MENRDYDFPAIEKKWQKFWDEHKTFKATEDPSVPEEKRQYILDMFPYPSGAGLHVGHPEGYTATDIYSRYLRMNGYNVLHPMGYDAFGLPAENYAIKTGTGKYKYYTIFKCADYITTVDNKAPVISLTPSSATTNKDINVVIKITDNVGVDSFYYEIIKIIFLLFISYINCF